ncbi:MAG: NADPH-dependent F420 reductase [Solirubrobacteraceae bacterium]
MKIGIVGSGNIGGMAARLFVNAGHEVAIANSRGPESLDDLVAELGDGARAATPEQAVEFGDAVILAIPWRLREQLPDARLFEGKITIDAMNPYSEDFQVIDLEPSSSSEEVEKQLKGARLVKALNHLRASDLGDAGRPGGGDERAVLFMAGDDEDAKQVVGRLIADIGFAAVDTGDLATGGRLQQPGSKLYIQVITEAQAPEALRDLP